MIFEVKGNGELFEINDSDFEPQEELAYIFISTYDKTCYLWFGEKSGPREKFVAANEARKIKLDTSFNTTNVQHDEKEDEFNQALENWRKDLTKGNKPAKILLEQRTRIQDLNKETDSLVSGSTKNYVTSQKIGSRQETQPTDTITVNLKIDKREILDNDQLEEIITKLSALKPIEGYTRDYIVTSGYVYSTSEIGDKIEVQLLDGVKDGVFMVDNYKSRFYIEDSSLIAIELWRIPK